jgi:hypothetical protein
MKLLTNLYCLTTAIFWISSASAQVETTKTTRIQESNDVTVELKPIPLIANLVPGVGSIGIGGEIFANENISIFSNLYYTDVNLPNRISGTMADRAEDPVPDAMTSINVSLGGRFYGSPLGSTWYTGAAVGYIDSTGKWEYEDVEINHSLSSVTIAVEGGYRWRWPNNVLVRLGGGLASNNIQSSSYTSDSTSKNADDGKKKVKELNSMPVMAAVDLGLGYMF